MFLDELFVNAVCNEGVNEFLFRYDHHVVLGYDRGIYNIVGDFRDKVGNGLFRDLGVCFEERVDFLFQKIKKCCGDCHDGLLFVVSNDNIDN